MGAGASTSLGDSSITPCEHQSPEMDGDSKSAIFTILKTEYEHLTKENIPDEGLFDRMKQLCVSAYNPDAGPAKTGLAQVRLGGHRRMSDAHRKKNGVVFSKGLDINSTDGMIPHRPSESKTAECVELLKQALQSVLITGSSDDELDKVLFVMQRLIVEPGENVIQQGDSGDKFYVVQSGSLEVMVNSATVGYLRAGNHFGELALIYDAPRAATVKSATKSTLWTLDRDEFRMIQARSSSNSLAKRAKWLTQVEILSPLSARQLALLAGVLKDVTFAANEAIIQQGDVGDTFFIVEEGRASCQIDGGERDRSNSGESTPRELARFGPGDYFGEMALLTDMPRNASVYALEETKCLTLERHEFDSMLGPLTEVLDRNSRIRILKMVPYFMEKPGEIIDQVVSQLEIKAFHDSQCIYRQGDVVTAMYIVKTGCVKLIQESKDDRGKTVTQETLLKANATFGSEMFEEEHGYLSTAISCGRSQCHRLKQNSLASNRGRRMSQATQGLSLSVRGMKKYSNLTLEDIKMDTVLGEGSFGKVVMVHTTTHGPEDKPMALKIMAKSHIVESDQQIQVVREKQVLMSLPSHPFIVELYATYQDKDSLYMLMELVQGGELFTLLHNEEFIETVDEAAVRFYAANVVMGLQHLHKFDYAYRDLKPENLLITKEGYLKFVDFGFAKRIPFTVVNSSGVEELHSRTYTLCGTLEYLAPEFVLNTGHDLAVDYWALGILIYEMLVGYTPFGTGDGDTTQLFRNIAMVRTGANAVDFPFHLLENCPSACDLVRRLLQGDPAKRIGVGINGDQEIRQHSWFSKIEWERLYAMQLEPPYSPPLRNEFDTSLFEGEIGNRAKDKPFDGKGDEAFVDF